MKPITQFFLEGESLNLKIMKVLTQTYHAVLLTFQKAH